MADDRTIEVYQRQAAEWTSDRHRQDDDHAAWVERERGSGPVLDIGCGPGWNLPSFGRPRIGLDATAAMLELVGDDHPETPRVRGLAERLPIGRGLLGGAFANRVHLHLPLLEVPMALAELHRAMAPGAPAFVRVLGQVRGPGRELRSQRRFAGRLFSTWDPDVFERLCIGAGFEVEDAEVPERSPGTADEHDRQEGDADGEGTDEPLIEIGFRLRRAVTLADTVGGDMRLLICGLNPSPYSAEVGVGFGRPGNRFWPAARASGLVSVADNDPAAALTVDRVGMTDLVKRPTRRADELSPEEYATGLARVERLVAWLRPQAICFVGLAGWRAAVDRTAVAGPQDTTVGDRPVYLMPSTSGLNAHATPDSLTEHLRAAAELADAAG